MLGNYWFGGRPLTVEDVNAAVDMVAGTQVTTYMMCTGSSAVYYPSKYSNMLGDDRGGTLKACYDSATYNLWRRYWDNEKRLEAEGTDMVSASLARARERGLETFITLRMNDLHFADTLSACKMAMEEFWLQNPQFWTNDPSIGYNSAGALDYAHPQVREHKLALIREQLERFGPLIDGVDLDFMRFFVYFRADEARANSQIMTQFLCQVRSLVDSCAASLGRPLLLSARVAPTLAYNMEKGLDVAEWVRRGLLDFVSIGTHWRGDPSLPVGQFRTDLAAALSCTAGCSGVAACSCTTGCSGAAGCSGVASRSCTTARSGADDCSGAAACSCTTGCSCAAGCSGAASRSCTTARSGADGLGNPLPIPLYASIDDGGFRSSLPGAPREFWTHGAFRGMASAIFGQGADGLYLFNYYFGEFQGRNGGSLTLDPGTLYCRTISPELLNELGSTETLRRRNKVYALSENNVQYGIHPNTPFPLRLAAGPKDSGLQASLRCGKPKPAGVGEGLQSAGLQNREDAAGAGSGADVELFVGDNVLEDRPIRALLFVRKTPGECLVKCNGVPLQRPLSDFAELAAPDDAGNENDCQYCADDAARVFGKDQYLAPGQEVLVLEVPVESLLQGVNSFAFSATDAPQTLLRLELALIYGPVGTNGYF